MIKTQIDQLLQKEMDRKDFIRHIGIAIAVVVGLPTIMKTLSHLQSGSLNKSSTRGYGSSAYGGPTLK